MIKKQSMLIANLGSEIHRLHKLVLSKNEVTDDYHGWIIWFHSVESSRRNSSFTISFWYRAFLRAGVSHSLEAAVQFSFKNFQRPSW